MSILAVNVTDFICQNESMVQFDKDLVTQDFTNVVGGSSPERVCCCDT
jgi:hypothetical protein